MKIGGKLNIMLKINARRARKSRPGGYNPGFFYSRLCLQTVSTKLLNKLTATCSLVALSLVLSVPAANATEYEPYKIPLGRDDSGKPVRKSSVMAEVNRRWPGQILHIRSDSSGGPDCHIVKSMGNDGEFRIIRVACRD
jgi:hypothetical protein